MTDQHKGGRGIQRETVVVPRIVPRPREGGSARVTATQRNTIVVNPRQPNRLRGVLTAGLVTSAWNSLVVLAPILVVVAIAWWIAGHPGGFGPVAQTVGGVWLLGHAVPVNVAGLTIGIPPLALTAVIFWRLSKAGAHTIRAIQGRNLPAVRAAVLAVTIGYTSIATGIAFAVSKDVYEVRPSRVALHAAVLAIAAASLGALSESGAGQALWHRMPIYLRRGIRTGTLATIGTLAAGVLLVGAALALRGGLVVKTVAAYPQGSIGIGLLCLLFLPTVSVWAAAYLLGPGFMVGLGTQVSIMNVDILPLPVFPLFAAVPDAPLDTWGTALLGVPLAIGSAQGVLLAIRSIEARLPRLLWSVVFSGLTAAVVAAGLAYLSAGALGGGQLAHLGAPVGRTGMVAGAMIGGSVLVGALAARMFGARRKRG